MIVLRWFIIKSSAIDARILRVKSVHCCKPITLKYLSSKWREAWVFSVAPVVCAAPTSQSKKPSSLIFDWRVSLASCRLVPFHLGSVMVSHNAWDISLAAFLIFVKIISFGKPIVVIASSTNDEIVARGSPATVVQIPKFFCIFASVWFSNRL